MSITENITREMEYDGDCGTGGNQVAPTKDPSSRAAGCDEELRQTSVAEEKNIENSSRL